MILRVCSTGTTVTAASVVWAQKLPTAANWRLGLNHCGLLTPYGEIDLGQHWPDGTKPLPEPVLTEPSITKIRLKITYLKFHFNFPGANELNKPKLFEQLRILDLMPFVVLITGLGRAGLLLAQPWCVVQAQAATLWQSSSLVIFT